MLLLLTLLGCDPAATATDMCRERRTVLDGLYTRYGGSEAANATAGGPLGSAVGETDRAEFERKCLLLGQGGHPVFLSDKARTFFALPDTVAACQHAVDLETQVKILDRKLSATDQVTCP